MSSPADRPVTRLLAEASAGRPGALAEMLPLVYDELRSLAARQLRRERAGHTLQPTALVHDAYLRLVDQQRVQWSDRGHFFAVAAQAMRRVLVDHARARHASKRGGRAEAESLDEGIEVAGEAAPLPIEDILLIDTALQELQALDPDQARLVELRYFGGLTIEEAAEALGTSPATVKREWTTARAWLHRRITTGR